MTRDFLAISFLAKDLLPQWKLQKMLSPHFHEIQGRAFQPSRSRKPDRHTVSFSAQRKTKGVNPGKRRNAICSKRSHRHSSPLQIRHQGRRAKRRKERSYLPSGGHSANARSLQWSGNSKTIAETVATEHPSPRHVDVSAPRDGGRQIPGHASLGRGRKSRGHRKRGGAHKAEPLQMPV